VPTARRAAWFTAAFVFAMPPMLAMFKDGDLTRDTWVRSVGFAVSIAVIVAIFFGEDTP